MFPFPSFATYFFALSQFIQISIIKSKISLSFNLLSTKCSYFPDKIGFGGVEWSPIRVDHIMKPLLGDRVSLLGPPRVVGLSSPVDKSPVNRPYIVLLKHWQMGHEMRHHGSGHILSADYRSLVCFHSVDGICCALLIAVGMESYNITFGQYEVVKLLVLDVGDPMARR